jgi:cold shock CspA family protein
MCTGTVLFFDPYKGFGKIINHETNKEIFVHINQLIEQVYKDDTVVFELEIIDGNEHAAKVQLHKNN